jgi:hypothetical protein
MKQDLYSHNFLSNFYHNNKDYVRAKETRGEVWTN